MTGVTRGLALTIYRASYLASERNRQGGISRCSRVTLVGAGVPEVSPVSDTAPAVVLDRREGYIFARPSGVPPEGCTGWMAGGCIVSSTDPRFYRALYPDSDREAHGLAALALHDRCEPWEAPQSDLG